MMNIDKRKIYLLVLYAIVALGVVANIKIFHYNFIGLVLGLPYLVLSGYLLGRILFHQESSFWKTILGNIFFLAGIISVGTIIFYIYRFNTFIIVLILMLFSSLLIIISFLKNSNQHYITKLEDENIRDRINIKILTTFFLFLEIILFYILFRSTTDLAIRSPWGPGVVPQEFFIIYFLTTLILVFILYSAKKSSTSLLLICIHFFLSTSVAFFVYKIGYGFDSFLHQAAEKILLQDGIIFPKPFYYIGQYVLVAFLATVTSLSVEIVDKLLIIIFYSFLIPPVIYCLLHRISGIDKFYVLIPLSFLAFPYKTFIVTTPQALANIFTLILIFLSFYYFHQNYSILKRLPTLLFLSLAILFIHPLAGIPAFIFITILCLQIWLNQKPKKSYILKNIIFGTFLGIMSIIIPSIFFLNSLISKSFEIVIKKDLFAVLSVFKATIIKSLPYFQNNYNIIFDMIYVYANNFIVILIIIAFIGFLLLVKKSFNYSIYFITFIVLFLNYILLTNFIVFSFLPDYERQNYSERFLEVSILFLLPYILFIIYSVIIKIQWGSLFAKFGFTLFLASIITISLYLSYPRDDSYHVDRGYNVTTNDIEAVQYIHQTGPRDYIVLASPVTAAAAVKEFGFYKYYPDRSRVGTQHFYYSIPTGGPLYQYYVKLVTEAPERGIVEEALDFIDVGTAYFVINKYWWKFDSIVEKAKQNSDEWYSINNGGVYIFKYTKSDHPRV